jgi:hypothetical protein
MSSPNVNINNSTANPVPVVLSPGSAGLQVKTAALASSKVIKASAGTLYHVVVSNTKASAQFCQIFDSATLPSEAAVPLVSFKLPAGDARSYDVQDGMPFTSGIVVCNSSTQATKTIGSADCLFFALVR